MPFDEASAEPLTEPDTSNATKFDARDLPGGNSYRGDGVETLANHYHRLSLLNQGIWTGTWADKSALNEQDNLAVFDAVASQLELTNYQKTRARLAFVSLDLQELSSPHGIDAALVAAMTAAVVAREDGRMYHPSRADNNNDALFLRLLDDADYDDRTVRSAYEKVLHRVDL